MGTVIVGLSISLDGFIAGANDGPANPMGDGGARLFTWMSAGPPENRINDFFTPPDASRVVIDEWLTECGAMVSGRRTFDIAGGWRYGHPIDAPIFVVTHDPPTEGEWSPRVTFVTEGVERAIELAQEVAGDRTVALSAASVAQQALRAGLLDEIHLNVVPCLLGGGVRLLDDIGPDPIDLVQTRIIESDGVTHLRYRVER
jgi:dihydrofolate reductase